MTRPRLPSTLFILFQSTGLLDDDISNYPDIAAFTSNDGDDGNGDDGYQICARAVGEDRHMVPKGKSGARLP
ncbi:hypothetical protein BU24DRAFT_72029 [Aaosphaeria arxii CBS 175.79]|uniref:Uncharacterized protein n=1 Tax=Aaosphaeria arxii CBS 175.79 TaxID=1450172 RepID=A0A6A5XAP9_9PLEO|nr:uncharacterized protein BU24DRAFT_72029 [Aaosphaeria arxii CBS 175.79]KAF2010145.1 hypothetical protein BU24DRAFT_72029 [Aaosphaeria arxii CBS 175.79]